jgi:hypothetical protein
MTDGGVLALEAEEVLDFSGGGETFVDFMEESDVVEDFSLTEGWGTGDGVGVH